MFSSKADCLPKIRDIVSDAARSCGFSDADIHAVKVSVSEACANAIEHGSPKGADDTFEFEFECDGRSIRAVVRDHGIFRRREGGEHGHLSPRGRGTYLMMALMDSFSLQESPKGTTITLTKTRKDSGETG